MKISLSGPMTGIPDLNYPAFNEAAAKLRAEGHDVFNPAELPDATPYNLALVSCLAILCYDREAIALLDGWHDSKGARSELHTALALDLKVIHLSIHRVPENTVSQNENAEHDRAGRQSNQIHSLQD
jgi:hypothetical protein